MRAVAIRGRSDRGAVLVIVAAFSIVSVLFLAFVVDIGNQRQNRRQLTTETDAVALGVAKDWASSSLASSYNECSDAPSASRLSVYNNPNKNPSPDPVCTYSSPNPFQGFVTVSDGETAEYAFDGVTGVAEGSTGSSSTVAVSVVEGGGLRPLGLCLNDVDLQSWLTTGSPAEFDIFAPKFLNPLCVDGASPGNWSQVVLPPSKANQNDWRGDVENGAQEDVSVNQKLKNLTGVGMNSAAQEFKALEGTDFFLPVYTYADKSGGSQVVYPVSGFLEVRLVSSDISGSSPSFRIRPLRLQTADTCCFANGFNVELSLCDVGTIGGTSGTDLSSKCLAPLPPPVTTSTTTAPCSATLSDPKSQTVGVTVDRGKGRLNESRTFTYTLANPGSCGTSFTADVMRGSSTVVTVSGSLSGTTVTVTLPAGLEDFQRNRSYDIVLKTATSSTANNEGVLATT